MEPSVSVINIINSVSLILCSACALVSLDRYSLIAHPIVRALWLVLAFTAIAAAIEALALTFEIRWWGTTFNVVLLVLWAAWLISHQPDREERC